MTHNFVAVVNALPPICCHIGSGLPDVRIFAEETVASLGTMNR